MTHVPVLLEEVLQNCDGIDFSAGWFLDGTFGRGGHTKEILSKFPEAKVIGLDRDLDATQFGKENFKSEIASQRLELHQSNFTDFQNTVGDRKLVGCLLDLGVSSPQLDIPERGFSFYKSGPLDMRMDQSQTLSAKEIVNNWEAADLAEIFMQFGEIRRPQRVVERILELRKKQSIETTQELANLIESSEGWRKKGHHPATNYFQALRIQVNAELDAVTKSIEILCKSVIEGGRILVITFHSLEDRIVKNAFRNAEKDKILFRINKKVIVAAREEQKANPRSRSAKLRVVEIGVKT